MIKVQSEKCFLGDAMKISNGIIEIVVTMSVGPRIISIGKVGGQNLMFNDVDDAINRDCSAIYGEGKHWHLYGGHRMWLSPEDESTYYPDNDKVRSTILSNGVVLTPKEWKVVNVQPSMKIEFIADNKLRITHKVINKGEAKKLCIWALTVLKSGGEVTAKLPTRDTGFLANSNLAIWSYNEMGKDNFGFRDGGIFLKSSPEAKKPFKIGLFNENLRVAYRLGRDTLIKETEVPADGEYPDFHCNFESYTSSLIHEVETLSPMVTVEKGKELEHIELWTIE